jgi:DNA-binding winged helix-turn-helix (wHTH) protein
MLHPVDCPLVSAALRKVLDETRNNLNKYRTIKKKGLQLGADEKAELIQLEHRENRLTQIIAELDGSDA